MKHSAYLLAVLAIAGFLCSSAFADLDNLDIGGRIKVLGVYAKNYDDFNDDAPSGDGMSDDQTAFARTEAHLWFQAELAENVSARVSLETDRHWENEAADLGDGGDLDALALYLEEAYVKVADLYGVPVTITIGRQFIEIGDGFVLGDSLPWSPGSIAVLGEHEQDPFDAIKIDYELTMDWLLTAVWSKEVETDEVQEDSDIYMLNLGFYGLEAHIIEAYYLLGKVDGDGDAGIDADDVTADLHQVGIRAEGELMEGLTYHGEATFQLADEIELGNGRTLDLGGWAGELGVKWAPAAMEANEVAFGFTLTYLSGDDDANDEDYDAYIQVADNRVYGEIADFFDTLVSNTPAPYADDIDNNFAGVMIFNVDAEMAFTDRLKGALEFYYFLADEDVVWGREEDDSIGWEIDAYLNYEITEDLSAMLAAGLFDPDDAAQLWNRDTENDDSAVFIRGGVCVNF